MNSDANNKITYSIHVLNNLFADLRHFYNSEIGALQAMLTSGMGCQNVKMQEGMSLLRKRIIEVPPGPSSFFDVVADDMQNHPDNKASYTGPILRITTYRFLQEQKKILEVFIIIYIII